MSTVGASYRAVLMLPHARRLFLAAAVGRLSYAVLPLALFFAVRDRVGSFGAAGLVMAAFNLTVVLCGPIRARFIDRYGRRRALPLLLTGYVLAVCALLAAVALRAPTLVLLLLAAVAGSTPPPLGPAMRGIWADLAPDSEHRQRAYSLDAVVEELLFTLGPLLTGLLLAIASAWYAAGLGLVLLIAGTLTLVASPASAESRATRSPAARSPATASPATASPATASPAKPSPAKPSPATASPAAPSRVVSVGPRRVPRRGLLRRPGFAPMLCSVAGVSVALGLVEVAAPVSAARAGLDAVAGVLLGALSAGSALGGLLYGRRRWTRPLAARLSATAALLAVTMALIAAAPALWLVGIGLALAGLFVSPTLIIGYSLADELAPPQARTEANTWVNTAGNAGSSAGIALAGVLADHVADRLLYLIGAGVLAIVVITVAGRRPALGRSVPLPGGPG